MNIRKLIYLPTEAQKKIIVADVEHILSGCDKIAVQERKEQKENQEFLDGVCPKCRARKEDIVDKINHVIGDGQIDGSFSLGFGKVSGSISIDTTEVNHCNKCGNEWKKFKTKHVSKTNILIVALNYLGEIFEDPIKNKKHDWKLEAVEVFDGCCAEAIDVLVNKNSHNLRLNTRKQLKLFRLRQQYKSVYERKI